MADVQVHRAGEERQHAQYEADDEASQVERVPIETTVRHGRTPFLREPFATDSLPGLRGASNSGASPTSAWPGCSTSSKRSASPSVARMHSSSRRQRRESGWREIASS